MIDGIVIPHQIIALLTGIKSSQGTDISIRYIILGGYITIYNIIGWCRDNPGSRRECSVIRGGIIYVGQCNIIAIVGDGQILTITAACIIALLIIIIYINSTMTFKKCTQ